MRLRTVISATAAAALISALPLAAQAQASTTADAHPTARQTIPVSLTLDPTAVTEGAQDNVSDFAQWNANGQIPAKQVYVQQSANGTSGWSTIGTAAAGYPGEFAIRFNVTDPHGYWRLYSPAVGAFQAGYSNVVHYFRYNTCITGGRPNTTTVHQNQWVTVSGNVWQQGFGPWGPLSGGTVELVFQPSKGAGAFMAHTTTDAHGHFTVSARPSLGSGSWSVMYEGSPRWDVMANGPAVYVRVS